MLASVETAEAQRRDGGVGEGGGGGVQEPSRTLRSDTASKFTG